MNQDVDVAETTTPESIAKTAKRYPDPENDKTGAESIQQSKGNLDAKQKIVYGTNTGKFLDPLKVEQARLKELRLVSKRKTHWPVKDAGERGGHQELAKWL